MKKFFVGQSPLTTLAGYVLAILTGIHQASAGGAQSWQDFLVPIAIALFGRLAADDHHDDLPPAVPSVLPITPEPLPPCLSEALSLPPRKEPRKRSANGRFLPLFQ